MMEMMRLFINKVWVKKINCNHTLENGVVIKNNDVDLDLTFIQTLMGAFYVPDIRHRKEISNKQTSKHKELHSWNVYTIRRPLKNKLHKTYLVSNLDKCFIDIQGNQGERECQGDDGKSQF